MNEPQPGGAEGSAQVAGFDGREEFGWKLTFAEQLRQILPVGVMLLVVTFLLALLVLNVFGAAYPLLAGLIAVVFTGVCVVLKGRQYANKFAPRTLTMEPHGVTYRDRDFTVDMPWERVHGIGMVPELNVLKLDTRVGRRVAGIANAAQGASPGLEGGGTLSTTQQASAGFRMQIHQNLKAAPVDRRPDSRLSAFRLLRSIAPGTPAGSGSGFSTIGRDCPYTTLR